MKNNDNKNNNVLTAFKEYKNFKQKKPWDFNKQVFPTNVFVPPHYAETIEVLLCYNTEGVIHIGSQTFKLCGEQAFFIAPTVVHSIEYHKNDGFVYVLKINTPQFKSVIDLEALLSKYNKTMLHLPPTIENNDAIKNIAKVFSSSGDIIEILHAILSLFDILLLNSYETEISHTTSDDLDLCKIIKWSEDNYQQRISIDDVASVIGYEKHYFCYKFKKWTGITYLNYLNNLRINKSCKALKNGATVAQACEMCGFNDMSYFIQLFKKLIGTTPKKYLDSTKI